MASIFKPAGKSKYVIFYHDEDGERHKKTGATDKQVTERIARDIENRIALRREGLIDSAAERFADSERKPIQAHLDDFVASMQARGCDPKHVRSTRTYVARILAVARLERFPACLHRPRPWLVEPARRNTDCRPAPSTPTRPPSKRLPVGRGRITASAPTNWGTSAAAMSERIDDTSAAPWPTPNRES